MIVAWGVHLLFTMTLAAAITLSYFSYERLSLYRSIS